MHKKGLSLVELLGALVIFGLVLSLSAVILSLINQASDTITQNAQANREGLLVDRTLKTGMMDFAPTDYSTCGGQDCLVLEKHFSYAFDELTETINLEVYDPALTHTLEIKNGELTINGVLYVFDGFELGGNSNIEVIETIGVQVYIIITIELIAPSQDIYVFTTSYSYPILAIPAA